MRTNFVDRVVFVINELVCFNQVKSVSPLRQRFMFYGNFCSDMKILIHCNNSLQNKL